LPLEFAIEELTQLIELVHIRLIIKTLDQVLDVLLVYLGGHHFLNVRTIGLAVESISHTLLVRFLGKRLVYEILICFLIHNGVEEIKVFLETTERQSLVVILYHIFNALVERIKLHIHLIDVAFGQHESAELLH
jgi:hypothetical protein